MLQSPEFAILLDNCLGFQTSMSLQNCVSLIFLSQEQFNLKTEAFSD